MKYLRSMVGKRYEYVRKKVGVMSIKESEGDKKFMCFGHLIRMREKRRVRIWETGLMEICS